MWSKRDFVKGAAAALAGVVMPIRAASPVDIVVYNDWYAPAHAFATDLAQRGALALPLQGDAGKLWYDTLRGLVTGGSRRIAGMTTHTDLFILETLARDHGLKVRHRHSDGGARLVSWVLT